MNGNGAAAEGSGTGAIAPNATSSPGNLIAALTEKLNSGDLVSSGQLLGNASGGDPASLTAAFGDSGYGPAPSHAPAEVGEFGEFTRWVIPMQARQSAGATTGEANAATTLPEGAGATADGTAATGAASEGLVGASIGASAGGLVGASAGQTDNAPERVFFDLAQAATDPQNPAAARPWEVRQIIYPPAVLAKLSAAGIAAPSVSGAPVAGVRGTQDAMVMADSFITAVTGKDFVSALGNCATDVPEEKIAGLCIVFEEGDFKLRKERPLVTTGLGNDTAWVIAHVVSEKVGSETEFGLEMKQKTDGSGWQIEGINFGKMLDTYVTASEAGKVPYTPIKTSPDTGELLVLYFEYDQASLLPRAQRQLEILAGILKADPDKKLTIAGHADSTGSENYNAALSAARAASVKRQLVVNGVPEPQVDTEGFGEAQPWKAERMSDGSDNPRGRSYNRRAEIYLNFSR